MRKLLELAEVALSDLSSRPTLLGTEPAPCSLPSRQNLPDQGGATQSPRWAPGGFLRDFIWGESLRGKRHQHGCEHEGGALRKTKEGTLLHDPVHIM